MKIFKSRLFLTFVALLTACGGGGSASNSASTAFPSEVITLVDQARVRLLSASDPTGDTLATVTIPGVPATYSRSGNTTTVTMPRHQLPSTGYWVNLKFAAGTGGTATSGNYAATFVDDSTFTVTDTASGTITGGTLYFKPLTELSATYVQSGTTMTVTLPGHLIQTHSSGVGELVDLVVTSGGGTSGNYEAYPTSTDSTNSFTVTTTASASASGNVTVRLGTNWTTFDTLMHPSGKWLYTISAYDCAASGGEGPFACGKGDVITQFDIDWTSGTLTHKKSYRSMPDTELSSASPVTAAFNANGNLMAVTDADLGALVLWSVNTSTGELTYVAQSANSSKTLHGVAFSGNYVYSGAKVFQVSSSAINRITDGQGLNDTIIRGDTLYGVKVGGSGGGSSIEAYSLADPEAPARSTTLVTASTGTASQRAMTVNASGRLIVTSGWDGLKTFTYDPSVPEFVDPGYALQADGRKSLQDPSEDVMYRSVNFNSTGTAVVASYFSVPDYPTQGGVAPSGFLIANVDSDGALTRVRNIDDAMYARIARYMKRPD